MSDPIVRLEKKVDDLACELRSYAEMNATLIAQVGAIEKVSDQMSQLVSSHEKSITEMVVYLKEINDDRKRHPLSELSRDVDSAHDKLREHDRILTSFQKQLTDGFQGVNDHLNKIESKPGQNALKAGYYAIGIIATVGITWLMTNILNGLIVIGG